MRKRFGMLFALLVVSCGTSPFTPQTVSGNSTPTPTVAHFALKNAFPPRNSISGWAATGEPRLYDAENLFDLVDGQAEAFFAYGFEQVATQMYTNAGGSVMRVEIWQLTSPADAFGLFTTARAGTPVAIGSEGDADPGRRLSFWQQRYYIQVSAQQKLPDAEVRSLAQAVAAGLPVGGEPPAIVARVPAVESITPKIIFFRQEISAQSEIWLGGKNLLGLGRDTEGIIARYEIGGATARLLLVQYPSVDQCIAGLEALQSGQIKNLIMAGAHANMLGAVFGKTDKSIAEQLLADALADP